MAGVWFSSQFKFVMLVMPIECVFFLSVNLVELALEYGFVG